MFSFLKKQSEPADVEMELGLFAWFVIQDLRTPASVARYFELTSHLVLPNDLRASREQRAPATHRVASMAFKADGESSGFLYLDGYARLRRAPSDVDRR